MTLQKIEFEYDIPDGYRFVRYSAPLKGNKYLNNGEVVEATWDYANEWPIVEKIPEQEQQEKNSNRHKHADLIHAWAEGAEIQYKNKFSDTWENVVGNHPSWGKQEVYRIKPKNKTIRFRNYLNKSGLAICVSDDISDKSYFKKWLGDWQEAEVEDND